MRFEVQLPDLSDARFRRDVGVGRINAAVALAVAIVVFWLTLTQTGARGALAFAASYLVIPISLAIGMLLTRRFHVGKLFQASIIVALVKFLITVAIHLLYR